MALIAHWPLNGDLLDISGNNNHLSLYNNNSKINITASGKIGQGYKRTVYGDGSDYLRSANKVDITNSFTMTAWVYMVDAGTSANGIVTNHDHSVNLGAGITIKEVSTTDFRISCNTGSGTGRTYYSYYGTTNIKDKWAHLTMRFYRNTNTFDLLVDGVVEKTQGYTMSSAEDYIELFSWSLGYHDNASYRPACTMNDVRIYDHALTDTEIQEIARAKILHYTFNDMQDPTTNIIPNSPINSYPDIGNGHRSYNTNNYNSNNDYSIGTMGSVTDNIVTLATVGRVINDFDVLNAGSTGGGVTAGTEYLIKKHSANSFSLHAYDSTEDGSNGYMNPETGKPKVHDSYYKDERIAITASGFPLLWHGNAHRPNSGLVKEIIPNAYNGDQFNGHSFIRCHTEHRIDGGVDGMAYGVYAQVILGETYSWSFYYRAAPGSILNATVRLGLYTITGWSGDDITVTITDYKWHRYSFTTVAPGTGGTNMYWWFTKGTIVDITEIQCEYKGHPSEYIEDSREGVVRDYSGYGYDAVLTEALTPQWVIDSKTGMGAYKFSPGYINYPNINLTDGTKEFSVGMFININSYITNAIVIGFAGEQNTMYTFGDSIPNTSLGYRAYIAGSWQTVTNVGTLALDTDYHIFITYSPIDGFVMYLNGQPVDSSSVVGSIVARSSYNSIGSWESTRTFDGKIDDVRIYATVLSDADILNLYETRAEIEESGILFAKDFISNVEETTNLLNDGTIDTTMLTNAGWSGSAAPNGDGSLTRTSISSWATIGAGTTGTMTNMLKDGDIISYSGRFKVDYIPAGSTEIRFPIRFVNGAGSSISYNNWIKPIGEIVVGEWYEFKNESITVPSGTVNLGLYLYFTSASESTGIVTVREFQIEHNDHATPFVKDFRPLIQVPSTLVYGANEIMEQGIANFEDFSTIGITDGLVGYWSFNGNTKDYSGNNYHAVEYSAGVSPIINSDNITFESGDGLKVENIITNHMERTPFTIIILATRISGNRLLMGYAANTLECNVNPTNLQFGVRDSTGFNYITANITVGTEPFLYTATYDTLGHKLYVNGNFEVEFIGGLNDVAFGESLLFGNWTSLTQSYLGNIYYAKVFNRALTAEEIAIEYNTMLNNEVQIHESGKVFAKDIRQY